MGATLTVVNVASTPITTIKNALSTKGLITSTLYETTAYLIFSTPLTSKVLKIRVSGSNTFSMAYGDGWTNKETITNEVVFCNRKAADLTNLYCIADSDWFILLWNSATTGYYGYVGKLDSDTPLAIGFSSDRTYSSNNNAWNLSNGDPLLLVSLFTSSSTFKDSNGYLMKMALMCFNKDTQKLEMNGSAPAKIKGLYSTSWNGADYLGNNYYLTKSSTYLNYSGTAFNVTNTALLIEFD